MELEKHETPAPVEQHLQPVETESYRGLLVLTLLPHEPASQGQHHVEASPDNREGDVGRGERGFFKRIVPAHIVFGRHPDKARDGLEGDDP